MADETKTEPKKHAAPWYLIRNSVGKKDGMFTLSYAMGWVVILGLLVGALAGGSSFTIKAGSFFTGTWNIPQAEWAAAAALLPPLAAYVLRKRDDAKAGTTPAREG